MLGLALEGSQFDARQYDQNMSEKKTVPLKWKPVRSMELTLSSALEEICAQGRDGLALSTLCSKLDLSVEFRRVLWNNLLKIPTVQFQVAKNVYDRDDPSIQCFEDAEKLDLIIVAKDKLRDNFLGIYDFSLECDKKEFRQQRLALERIAIARKNGITQSQLSKEFGIEGNKIFYLVKGLEKRGLIIRQEAVDRTRGAGKQGQCTRLIHLYRYARHLGSQEKFEITKEEETEGKEDSNIERVKEDVLVKDYVPSMKAICDKLEEANSKVLVISDIKHDLGYSGKQSKHKWENDERCLHLLKKFSQMDFEQKTIRYVEGKEMKMGRCQIANQLVELPIEHQIYDAIDAAGFKGMLITEVGRRFGIDRKTNHKNCCIMSSKFGMPMQGELHNKTREYRIRTARNCKLSDVIPSRSKDLFSKNSSLGVVNPRILDGSAQCSHLLNSESDTLWKTNKNENEIELTSCSRKDSEKSNSISNTCKSQELMHETEKVFSNTGVHLVKSATMTLKPCQSLTVDGTLREQRILEWLQVEKIVLRAELYRLLVNLEKDKGTTMDRKTVDRILCKLEKQGQCKCIHLAVREIMNTGVNRKVKVVLHPSIQSLSSEVLGRIRDRLASFDKQTHGHASFRKNISSILVLDSVQRTQTRESSDSLALRMEAMRANGFISGKMVRAKLLHRFLWEYVCSSSAGDDVLSYGRQDHDLQNPYVTCNLFDVEVAIKEIPLELYLQVVGSTVKVDNMIEKFKKGVCLCDLSIQEYNDLNKTPAIRRLSSIISILQRLKLIRLVTSGSSDDGVTFPHASPVYALELKTCIEEPPLIAAHFGSFDLCPDRDAGHEIIRHEFILSNRDAIDEYWQVLEYTYAVVDPKAALHAFPGSTVHEIFGHKSWASVRGMTAAEQAKVLKLIAKSNFNEKLRYKRCKEIANNLNLTLEQVLRVCYAKLRRCNKFQDNLNAVEAECQPMESSSFSRKRKGSAKARALKHRKVDNETEPFCHQNLPRSAGSDKDFTGEENFISASPPEHETQLEEHQEEDHWKTSEKPAVNGDKYHSSTNHLAFSKKKSARQRRFPWTDEADRLLVTQYVKHRVGLRAKFYDKGRALLHNLPAPPSVCRRRMSFLKQKRRFRESLMSLCNMLREQHEKHLDELESRSMDDDDDCGPHIPSSSGAGIYRRLFEGIECNQNRGVQKEDCDCFNEENINFALEEVLRSRQGAMLEASSNGNVCDSQFPPHTGSSAAKFSRWLRECEKDFMSGGIDLTIDLQCGEIFHLFALVSSGELFIAPCVPVQGVGEAEFIRSLKHPSVFNDSIDSRREKGFPGIKLSVHRTPMPRAVSLESSFKNGEKFRNEHFDDGNYIGGYSATLEVGSNSSQSEIIKENLNLGSTVPTPGVSCESPWELMVGYATHLMPLSSSQEHAGTLSPEVFKAVYAAIQKAGDEGLAIREVSRVTNTLGEQMAELVIDVLQKFGQAEKVRFDGSLCVIAGSTKKPSSICKNGNDVQKFTIFNRHDDVGSLLDESDTINLHEDSMHCNVVLPGPNDKHDLPEGSKCYDANGINKKKIHKRIICQAFRIVMQNPGILEDDIIRKMDLPNAQHCKKLLRMMVRNKYLIVKKHQSTPTTVPALFRTLIGGNLTKSGLIYREHFFANPMRTSLL
ncbi:uncharacterized protein LOC111280346 isoform X2 [Durio zibethinus]|uniref:Uncharacterized protein LOC111280346 isoform X2 n=1 Tax=Durio zibethinus TaxID=66656 RepID=A0A6P5X6A4_DURZI|nr:uncharacterized protein LOC111280346 isoform X2 [Durio zibethinus]